jgi:hypothetical protein
MRGLVLKAITMLGLIACQSPVEEFAQGKLEKLCDGSIPVCSVHAACIVNDGDYLAADFPGGQRFIVQADRLDTKAIIRLYFEEMVFPGTEFQIKLYGPGCSTLETTHIIDVDLFDRAGDDRIVEFALPIVDTGDHLLEIYSDMAAAYLLTVDLER